MKTISSFFVLLAGLVKEALSSKRFWVILLMFVFNGLTAVKALVPVQYQEAVNGLLLVLGAMASVPPFKQ